MSTEEDLRKLNFGISKSIRYHAYRRTFFDWVDHWNKVAVLLFGVGVAFTLGAKRPEEEEIFAFALAFLAIFEIIFKWNDSERKHDNLYREYSALAREIAQAENPTQIKVRVWQGRRLEIETEEPGILDCLEKMCAHEEAIAQGLEPHPDTILPWYKRMLAQFVGKWPW